MSNKIKVNGEPTTETEFEYTLNDFKIEIPAVEITVVDSNIDIYRRLDDIGELISIDADITIELSNGDVIEYTEYINESTGDYKSKVLFNTEKLDMNNIETLDKLVEKYDYVNGILKWYEQK